MRGLHLPFFVERVYPIIPVLSFASATTPSASSALPRRCRSLCRQQIPRLRTSGSQSSRLLLAQEARPFGNNFDPVIPQVKNLRFRLFFNYLVSGL